MILIRPIYSPPISFRNTATLIVNANALPRFSDSSAGLFERLHIVPFDMDLRKGSIDPNLLDKLITEDAKSYILNLALRGAERIIDNGKLTDNVYTRKSLEGYKKEVDNITAFLDSIVIADGQWLDSIYKEYSAYCDINGLKRSEKQVFSKRLSSNGYYLGTIRRNKSKNTPDNRDRQIFNLQ